MIVIHSGEYITINNNCAYYHWEAGIDILFALYQNSFKYVIERWLYHVSCMVIMVNTIHLKRKQMKYWKECMRDDNKMCTKSEKFGDACRQSQNKSRYAYICIYNIYIYIYISLNVHKRFFFYNKYIACCRKLIFELITECQKSTFLCSIITSVYCHIMKQ